MPGREESITFTVEGMSCNHCKNSIESAVRALEGVTGAAVDLAQNQVKISFDPTVVKRDALEKAIIGAGYSVVH
ncbi:MAG: copper ion binding protein [Bacillota bacterium]